MRDKDKDQETIEAGFKRWPGLWEAVQGSIKEVEAMMEDPWVNARIKDEGPGKFKELLGKKFMPKLAKMPHDVLADVAAQALANVVFTLLVGMSFARELKGKEEKTDADDR